jgi:hypothetical protein
MKAIDKVDFFYQLKERLATSETKRMEYTKKEIEITELAQQLQEKHEEQARDEWMPRGGQATTEIKVGDKLYASCAGDFFGTIQAINVDAYNMDILVRDINEVVVLESGWAEKVPLQPVLCRAVEIEYVGTKHFPSDWENDDMIDTGWYLSFKTVDGCARCVRGFVVMTKKDQ